MKNKNINTYFKNKTNVLRTFFFREEKREGRRIVQLCVSAMCPLIFAWAVSTKNPLYIFKPLISFSNQIFQNISNEKFRSRIEMQVRSCMLDYIVHVLHLLYTVFVHVHDAFMPSALLTIWYLCLFQITRGFISWINKVSYWLNSSSQFQWMYNIQIRFSYFIYMRPSKWDMRFLRACSQKFMSCGKFTRSNSIISLTFESFFRVTNTFFIFLRLFLRALTRHFSAIDLTRSPLLLLRFLENARVCQLSH